MKNPRRFLSSILSLSLALIPGLAHAGGEVSRSANIGGSQVVAPLVLPTPSLGGVSTIPNVNVGVQTGIPSISAPSFQQAGPASPALGAPSLQPTAQASSAGEFHAGHAITPGAQSPLSSVAPESTQPQARNAALPAEIQAAAAVQNFQSAVAPQKNGSRVSRVASSLLGWLKPKAAETVPAVHAMAVGEDATGAHVAPLQASTPDAQKQPSGPTEPPVPPSNGGDGSQGPSSAWRNAVMFIGGLVVAQVGVEAWSAAWAKWVQTNYGLDAYSTITMVGMVVSLAAGYAGGWAADKFGLKKTYIASTILFAASAAATLLMFKAGALTFPFLIGLAAFRTFVGSAGRTAEQTIPIAIFKENKSALARFNSVSQFILEFAGIGVPFFIGALLGKFGSIGTMALLPITAVAAAGVYLFVKMGDVVKKKALTGPAKPDARLLKIAMMAYPTVALINFLLYAIVAIGYGNLVHPGSSPVEQAAAAAVAGKIVSLYSFGGLIAAAILSGIPGQLWGWLKKKFPKLGGLESRFVKSKPEEDEHTSEIKAASKWLVLSALGMAAFIPMLWTAPTIAALAMIPFGIANVMSTLQLMTLVQKNAPLEKKGKIMGGLRTITTVLSTAGLFGFTWLFKHAASLPAWMGGTPFVPILIVFAAIGVYYVVMSRKLKGTLDQK